MPLRTARLTLCLTVAIAHGAPAICQTTTPEEEIARAKTLIVVGQTEDARSLLEKLLRAEPDNVELLFLLGMTALADGNNPLAVARFRAALVVAPQAGRIRLEFARALYRDKDYENAFRQFQFALADNPPPGVVTTIERYLRAIRLEKDWSYNFGLAFAPDTNINNGTSAREAEIFGLPFEFGDETRKKSGVGLSAEGGVEFAPRLSDSIRLRMGGDAIRKEYGGRKFDDMTIALHAGPRIVAGKWDLSLLGTTFRRWYGGSRLNQAWGVRGEASWYPGPRTAVSLALSGHDLRYLHFRLQSGRSFSASARIIRALSPVSSVAARASLSRQTARAGEFSNWSTGFAVGYYRDLPGGFSIYAEPSLSLARNDREDSFFGERRKDWLAEMRLSLLNRRIVLSRFTPRVTYTFARRQSSLDLYDFTQSRLEMGFTTAF